jgi:fructokinase
MMKINDEEVIKIAALFGWNEEEQDICKRLLDEYNLNILILTKGTEGSFVFTARQTSYQPTPKVHVADTVGAGDSFTAAFVAAYLHGERIEDAHQLAVEVSAYVCLQHGAMPKLADAYLDLFHNRG